MAESATTTVDLSEFQEGAEATLSTVVPWGLAKRIMSKIGDGTGQLDVVDIILNGLVKSWTVKNLAGEAIPLPLKAGALDNVDSKVVMALTEHTNKIMEDLRGKAPGVDQTGDSSTES